MRYWIRDEDNTPQGFPLKKLIQLIIQQFGTSIFQFWLLRSQGYGIRICEWDKLLDKRERILVDDKILQEISSGNDEWFYNLDVEVLADRLQVHFGLHDSTALYIDAPCEFVKSVTNSFKLVQEVQSTDTSKMNYSIVDPILKSWVDNCGLHMHTKFKDIEIRSIDIVSPQGKRFQLWIDKPDLTGNTIVHIWDMKKKRKDFSTTQFTLKDKLEAAYQQVQDWY